MCIQQDEAENFLKDSSTKILEQNLSIEEKQKKKKKMYYPPTIYMYKNFTYYE